MKKTLSVRALAALSLATLIAFGCGGGGAKVESTTTSTTMGQELIDLDAAYKQGIINDDQYNASKKDIIRRYKN